MSEVLAKIAEKGVINTNALGQGVLPIGKGNEFIEIAEENSVILSIATRQDMASYREDIDTIEMDDFITTALNDNSEIDPDTEGAGVDIATQQLDAKAMKSICVLTDDAKKKNIEKDNFANTLVLMFGVSVGKDLARAAYFGDTTITGTTAQEKTYKVVDGFIKKAGNTISAVSSTKPSETLDALIKAVPVKYRPKKNVGVILCDSDFEDDLRNEYINRQTNLGDITLTEAGDLKYKGYKVVVDDMIAYPLPSENAKTTGRVVMFTKPANLVYGVFSNVDLEEYREALKSRTDFIIRTYVDFALVNPDATSVATLEK